MNFMFLYGGYIKIAEFYNQEKYNTSIPLDSGLFVYVTVIGILLAASMLTAVTTFISSLRQYMIDVSIENQGNWYGAAFGLPAEKIEELKADERTAGLALWQESPLWRKEDGRYIPKLANFLRRRMWEDVPPASGEDWKAAEARQKAFRARMNALLQESCHG